MKKLLLCAIVLSGCFGDPRKDFCSGSHVKEIDGCEYFVENCTDKVITHKANCKHCARNSKADAYIINDYKRRHEESE